MVTSPDQATAVKRVNETLKGPVAMVLSRLVPELKGMHPTDVYDRTLDDLDLLHRCFQTFRTERKKFGTIVVDSRNVTVEDDTSALRCGRTLQEVVAMVVRTAAKRHFRRVLPKAKGAVPRSPADELYEAIKEYLLHEWQVPLVPTYADMSPSLVRSLGTRLLDIREIEELRRLIDDPAAAAALPERKGDGEEGGSELSDRIAQFLTPDGQRLKVEAFNAVLLMPEVRAQLPQAERALKVTDMLRGVGGIQARLLMTGLKLSPEQFAVMVITAHGLIGPDVFTRLFGVPGQPELVLRIIARALAAGIGEGTPLPQCAAFTRLLFASAGAGAGLR
jgi:hypothetical protein